MTNQERLEDYWYALRLKKSLMESRYAYGQFNHPNRTSEISCSGSMSISFDERNTIVNPSNLQQATAMSLSVNFALLDAVTRYFLDVPMSNISALPDIVPAGQFVTTHTPEAPWFFDLFYHTTKPDEEWPIIGSQTITIYEYKTATQTWDQISTVTNQITGSIIPGIALGGYFVPSPVFDWNGGYSEASDDYKAQVSGDIALAGIDLISLPYLVAEEKRWPWDDAWGAVTGDLSANFAQYLSDNAGYSGSLSLAYNFS